MKRRVNRSKISLSIIIEPLDSEEKKEEWRREVLRNHEETSELATKVLKESRHLRSVLENSCDRLKEVINVWSDYEDRYDTAVKNLSERINKSFECDSKKNKKIRKLQSNILSVAKFRPSRARESSISTSSGFSFGSQ